VDSSHLLIEGSWWRRVKFCVKITTHFKHFPVDEFQVYFKVGRRIHAFVEKLLLYAFPSLPSGTVAISVTQSTVMP
jgi:hypothetical protein